MAQSVSLENPDWIECGICGLRFDPAAHIACAGCPIQKSCQLICCPRCGFETVDPGRSTLARLVNRLLPKQ